MGFTPRKLRRQLRAAAKRVEARGDRPPWKHPDLVTLTCAMNGWLSAREARWVHNHLASCRACVERNEQLARDRKKPVSSRAVAETLRLLEELEREGSSG